MTNLFDEKHLHTVCFRVFLVTTIFENLEFIKLNSLHRIPVVYLTSGIKEQSQSLETATLLSTFKNNPKLKTSTKIFSETNPSAKTIYCTVTILKQYHVI